jgi:hypothetical protein
MWPEWIVMLLWILSLIAAGWLGFCIAMGLRFKDKKTNYECFTSKGKD